MEDLFQDVKRVIDECHDTLIFKIGELTEALRYTWRGKQDYSTEDLKVAYKYFDETIKDIDKSMYTLGVTNSVTNNNTVYLHLVNIREFYVDLTKGIREELKGRDKL